MPRCREFPWLRSLMAEDQCPTSPSGAQTGHAQPSMLAEARSCLSVALAAQRSDLQDLDPRGVGVAGDGECRRGESTCRRGQANADGDHGDDCCCEGFVGSDARKGRGSACEARHCFRVSSSAWGCIPAVGRCLASSQASRYWVRLYVRQKQIIRT